MAAKHERDDELQIWDKLLGSKSFDDREPKDGLALFGRQRLVVIHPALDHVDEEVFASHETHDPFSARTQSGLLEKLATGSLNR
jgi:hypothetical protein